MESYEFLRQWLRTQYGVYGEARILAERAGTVEPKPTQDEVLYLIARELAPGPWDDFPAK